MGGRLVDVATVVLLITMVLGFRREVYFNGLLLTKGRHFDWRGLTPRFHFAVRGTGKKPDLITLRYHFGWFWYQRDLVADASLGRLLGKPPKPPRALT